MEEFFTEKRKKITLVVLFILSIFLITFRYTTTPKVWVDEGVFTETARNLAYHGTLALQVKPGEFFSMRSFLLSTSYPVILPVALSLKVLGIGVRQARLPMLFYMFLLVVAFYLFTKRIYGFYLAVLSVLMLLSFSPFYGNGRPVQGEVPGLFFLVLGLWLMLLWEESDFKSQKYALLTGLSFGLSSSVKPIFLLLLPFTFIITAFFWREKIKNNKSFWYFLAGYLLLVVVWFRIHFPTLKSLNTVIDSFLYFGGNHESSVGRFQTVFHNLARFFTESTPILFTFLFVIVLFYYSYNYLKKKKSNFSIAESVLLLFISLNWLGYLNGTGWYRYFFPAHTLLYLLFPAAILGLKDYFNNKYLKKVILIFPIFLIIFQFTYLIFLSDTSFMHTSKTNSNYEQALSYIPRSKSIFFYNTYDAIVFFKGSNYSQYTEMGGFLDVGSKKILDYINADYILIDDINSVDLRPSCYKEDKVNSYFLLTKNSNCKLK